jgi:hypothetical protein
LRCGSALYLPRKGDETRANAAPATKCDKVAARTVFLQNDLIENSIVHVATQNIAFVPDINKNDNEKRDTLSSKPSLLYL